ncbi:VOC family protein [Paraglaciecola arctica]|uniref:VOC family protein n=1 Tax=Paraglaciecola arctica TaxID=1128911 RepID=UPI001C07B803|nr:extradiol dioxygenase [Paraglaciecola arctica]MBU3002588.1 extradiol dioxygenase [Paraglaciecola arctica]
MSLRLNKHFLILIMGTLLSSAITMEYAYGASKDALAPKTQVQDALALPLHTVTIATVSLEQSLLFYRDGMGMQAKGPITISAPLKASQRKLWNMPDDIDWQTYHLYREGIDNAIHIRLLVLNKPMPTIHDSWNPRELGPFSLGFPNNNTAALDKHVRTVGFGSLNSLESYPIPRTDGSTYQIDETIFNAPDFNHGVAITRGNGMSQLGPIDQNGKGGPAYSAQIITDSENHLQFYTEVLGLEIRSDRLFKSAGEEGAMNLPNGTEFRFAIVYSKGATTGHMLFVDFKNIEPIKPKNAPSLPNIGLGMWSFPVRSLQQVLSNAKTYGSEIVSGPLVVEDPIIGNKKVATMRAPNGFLIEVFEELK